MNALQSAPHPDAQPAGDAQPVLQAEGLTKHYTVKRGLGGSGTVKALGVQVGQPQLVAGIGAIVITGLIYFFLHRTRLGAALEATASDKEAARLMGIDSHKMFALAWGVAAACAGAAGVLLSTFFPIFPDVGANFILLAFVVVNLGGFGSITGAFWAGILVGLIYSLINVRSPAPPIIALVGLLGILLGEQVIPLSKNLMRRELGMLSWLHHVKPSESGNPSDNKRG